MLVTTVADQQIVAAAAATLSWQPVDSDGEPADPGTVTVGVVRSDGTEVLAPLTATSGTATAARTVDLTAAQTATVDWLTATWTVSGTTVATTVHEVVGRPLLTRAEFDEREPKSSTVAKAKFLNARREVDDLFRRETRRGLTPRFAVERLTDRCGPTVPLRFPDVRAVRWARTVAADGTTTSIDVTGVGPSASGVVRFPSSVSGAIEVGYEHGYDRAPFDVVGAAARYLRYTIGAGTSSVPERATTWSDGQGGTTQLATPGLGPFITGVPEVDEVIVAHRWDVPGVA